MASLLGTPRKPWKWQGSWKSEGQRACVFHDIRAGSQEMGQEERESLELSMPRSRGRERPQGRSSHGFSSQDVSLAGDNTEDGE